MATREIRVGNGLQLSLAISRDKALARKAANTAAFSSFREIPWFDRVRGGPGRTRTSNQTVMSGVVISENPVKIDVFIPIDPVCSHPFTGFLWSICGPFPVEHAPSSTTSGQPFVSFGGPLGAKSDRFASFGIATNNALFDYLVGSGEQCGLDGQAESLGGF